jgi:cytochrome P450
VINGLTQGETPHHGVHFSEPLDCWVVDGYPEAVAAMREPALEIPLLPLPTVNLTAEDQAALTPLWEQARETTLYTNGDAHRRLRSELRTAFTAGSVDRRRPLIRAHADAAIEARAGERALEVIGDVAHPVLHRVMAEVVGVPARFSEEFDRLANASMDIGALATPQRSNELVRDTAVAVERLRVLIRELMSRPDELPAHSVLSYAAERRGTSLRLSEGELATNARSLYTAGLHTTVYLVASAAYLLFADEDLLREARRDETVIPDVVRETLRYACPAVEANVRRATQDLTIGAQSIRRGQFVRIAVLHANRDPRRFATPAVFDHRRPSQGAPLAYGAGPHVCLGNHLATAVAEEVLFALAVPHRDARLTGPDPVFERRAAIPVMWGPDQLHLELGPR